MSQVKLTMDWMRQAAVNILKYKPAFLYENEGNIKSVGTACSNEHEKIRLILQDIFNQFFVDTATWGLKYYEKELDITPKNNDSYEQRRKRILLKYQFHQTSTVAFLTNLAKNYFADNAEVTIEEDNPHGAFRIIADAVSYDIAGLIEAIETYKPAHLAYLIVHYLSAESEIYSGGIVQVVNEIDITQAIDVSFDISDINLYSAGIVQVSKTIKIPY